MEGEILTAADIPQDSKVVHIEAKNQIEVGDVRVFSNELGFEQLLGYLKGMLEDETFKKYLKVYEVQKMKTMVGVE